MHVRYMHLEGAPIFQFCGILIAVLLRQQHFHLTVLVLIPNTGTFFFSKHKWVLCPTTFGFDLILALSVEKKYEPSHVKTNNVAVHPAKTQISLGTRPV